LNTLICCIEIGLSLLRVEPVDNGFWWESAYPHTLELTKPGFIVGLSRDHWHIDYIHSGTFRSDAIATAGDAPNLARYEGHGWFQGVQVLWDFRWVLVGGMLYQAKWYEDTTERGVHGHFSNIPNLHIAPIVGFSHQWGNLGVGVEEQFMCISDRCKSGVYPPIWRNITMFSVTWKFQ
jgi:hypothetical protein